MGKKNHENVESSSNFMAQGYSLEACGQANYNANPRLPQHVGKAKSDFIFEISLSCPITPKQTYGVQLIKQLFSQLHYYRATI